MHIALKWLAVVVFSLCYRICMNGANDLYMWCSSTAVWLLSTQINSGRVCGACSGPLDL
jgi:hypothetical protein